MQDSSIVVQSGRRESEKAKLQLKKVVFLNTQDKGNEERRGYFS